MSPLSFKVEICNGVYNSLFYIEIKAIIFHLLYQVTSVKICLKYASAQPTLEVKVTLFFDISEVCQTLEKELG